MRSDWLLLIASLASACASTEVPSVDSGADSGRRDAATAADASTDAHVQDGAVVDSGSLDASLERTVELRVAQLAYDLDPRVDFCVGDGTRFEGPLITVNATDDARLGLQYREISAYATFSVRGASVLRAVASRSIDCGTRLPELPDLPIDLSDGERFTVVLRQTAAGVVAGTVVDDAADDRVDGVRVRFVSGKDERGTCSLAARIGDETYRWADVPPGAVGVDASRAADDFGYVAAPSTTSAMLSVEAGIVTVSATTGFPEGHRYTLFAIGQTAANSGDSATSVLVCRDAEPFPLFRTSCTRHAP